MLKKAMTTTGLYTLSTSKVAALEIPTAPLADQRTLSARLEAEKKEAASFTKTLTDKLAALDRLPAALLRRAFNGEL
jgi:type I restriction enzyme S subunit